jgi:hypothetical protein
VAVLALTLAGPTVAAVAAAPAAYTAPDDPAVPALIGSLRGCLTSLPAADQRSLSLRAGLDGHAPRKIAVVAAEMRRTPAAEATFEVAAIRKLESQRRRGACQAQAAKSPTAAGAAKAAGAGGGTGSSGSTDPLSAVLEVALPALLALAFVGGASRELLRDPHA